ncbi:cobyrinate a,c-diamide synthase [Pseudonocardiaceae bacterium YIM PH 21723]|nr:cobyrinate a,c-diamide synthase [Pseudonocardiaceae bacterium YIM PH 21723]
MVNIPRVVIAAPGSGAGKTTVATGLMGALREAGRRVAPGKVGPDYIDPGYHTLASGSPGRNLDPVLVGEDRVAPLFAHGAQDRDIAVVEGVMGLFDGRITGHTDGLAQGSTAHVSVLLDAPVILVVDARAQGQSLAALLHGFRSYRSEVNLAGVILNQVGSATHEKVLRQACEDAGLPVFGVLYRHTDLEVPSRHLGLITAAEHGQQAVDVVAAMTEIVRKGVDLTAVQDLAAGASPLRTEPWTPDLPVVQGNPVIAVAGGAAFTFGYAEHAELLRAAGATVSVVDPLRDSELPPGAQGLVLPGGFPEQHAAALSANVLLRKDIHAKAADGLPIHAECGGLLYLCSTLDGHPLCDVLPARAQMTPRLKLGYRDAVAGADSALFPAGTRVTGHEFHRTEVLPTAGDKAAWHWRGPDGRPHTEGFVHGAIHASYLHTHPAGNPGAITRFLASC